MTSDVDSRDLTPQQPRLEPPGPRLGTGARRAWRITIIAGALVIAIAFAGSIVLGAWAARSVESTTTAIPAGAKAIELDLDSASVSIRSDASASSVTVRTGRLPFSRGRSRIEVEDLSDKTVIRSAGHRGAGLNVGFQIGPWDNTDRVDVDLTPAQAKKTTIRSSTQVGALRIDGDFGSVSVHNKLGAAIVSGTYDELSVVNDTGATSDDGPLTVRGPLKVTSNLGAIDLALVGPTPSGPVELRSETGSIQLDVPRGGTYSADMRADVGSADSSLDTPAVGQANPTPITARTNVGSIELGYSD